MTMEWELRGILEAFAASGGTNWPSPRGGFSRVS